MPKKSTPMSWAKSMMARSASLLGRMSPKPMVETMVKDQYAAANHTDGPGMLCACSE